METMLTDPAAITAESFRRIDALLAPYHLAPNIAPIVRRVVHTTADLEWVSSLRVHPAAVEAATAALCSGTAVVTDVRMVVAGIQARPLVALGGAVHCAVDSDEVAQLARDLGITRSMAAMRLLAVRFPCALYVIGNAPTALFEVLRLCAIGELTPAVIIGVPVGFVSTIESKIALMASDTAPWISNVGPKGGSAVAAAIVNALIARAADVA